MPTDEQFLSAARSYLTSVSDFADLLSSARRVLDRDPLFGGLIAIHVTMKVEELERSASVLAVQCELAGQTAEARAKSIQVWREDELAYRAAYERWRQACASLEAAVEAAEEFGSGIVIPEPMPPEPAPPPPLPEWADLGLPPRAG